MSLLVGCTTRETDFPWSLQRQFSLSTWLLTTGEAGIRLACGQVHSQAPGAGGRSWCPTPLQLPGEGPRSPRSPSSPLCSLGPCTQGDIAPAWCDGWWLDQNQEGSWALGQVRQKNEASHECRTWQFTFSHPLSYLELWHFFLSGWSMHFPEETPFSPNPAMAIRKGTIEVSPRCELNRLASLKTLPLKKKTIWWTSPSRTHCM